MNGYSGTPLYKKLGITEGATVCVLDAPKDYLDWLEPIQKAVRFISPVSSQTDVVHVFCNNRLELLHTLETLRQSISPKAVIWVSWYKKSAKLPTEITEDVIREIALPMGLVDVKVCAVSELWSGLKLVIRKALRNPSQIE
jgi:hypothetical protein